jgi:hypothetical protein
MESKEFLTNEVVSKKFKNQFDLVNYAIGLTSQLIKSGRAPRVHADSDNPAVVIIEELEAGKDHWEEIIAEPTQEVLAVREELAIKVEPAAKSTERKKARRLFA